MFGPFAAVLLLLAAGCVSQKIEPAYIPRVSTAQNNQGMVTISWPSRIGYTYRLSAEDQGQVYVDRKEYIGTGEDIVVEFMRDPSKKLPDYRVIPEKIENR